MENKVAIITGAASGLGKALGMELFKRGYNLALLDIDIAGLESLKATLKNDNQRISIHHVDVSQEQQVIDSRTDIICQHQRIDILINNAAVSISQQFDQLSLDDYRWLFNINFWGTVHCTKHFLPDLEQQSGSRLVNIVSGFALMGFPGKTAYASSKSAVIGFTNSLKTELTGTSVTISLVIPPPLATGIVKNGKHINDEKRQKEISFLEKNGMQTDKVARKIISKINAGKYRIVIGSMTFWADLASRLFPTMVTALVGKNKKRFDFT